MLSFIEMAEAELAEVDVLLAETAALIGRLQATALPGELRYRTQARGVQYYLKRDVGKGANRRTEKQDLGGRRDERNVTIKALRFFQKKYEALAFDRNQLLSLLQHYRRYDPASIHNKLPYAFRDLPKACYQDSRYQELVAWANGEYKRNGRPFPSSRYITLDGSRVRSMDECMIHSLLTANRIPFRYDQSLTLVGDDGISQIRYPDFTFQTRDHKLTYWEHAGAINKEDYKDDLLNKLHLYHINVIDIGSNLILTMRDHTGGLDLNAIDLIVQNQLKPRIL